MPQNSKISEIEKAQFLTIPEFQEKYGNLRQELALRRIRGEEMSTSEVELLNALNTKMTSLLSSESDTKQIAQLKKFNENY